MKWHKLSNVIVEAFNRFVFTAPALITKTYISKRLS